MDRERGRGEGPQRGIHVIEHVAHPDVQKNGPTRLNGLDRVCGTDPKNQLAPFTPASA